MKVCDVVSNSVWYDPRVRKQLVEYINNGVEVVSVGRKGNRYEEDKMKNVRVEIFIDLLTQKHRFELVSHTDRNAGEILD